MGLVLGGFANALTEVAKVGTFGAAKYSDNGWEQVPNAEGRYTDALLRHVFKHMNGEVVDPEWGLFHLAHAAWNVLAVLEKELEKSRGRTGGLSVLGYNHGYASDWRLAGTGGSAEGL
jgi:hypothetical protein